jgi:hypothetical protein
MAFNKIPLDSTDVKSSVFQERSFDVTLNHYITASCSRAYSVTAELKSDKACKQYKQAGYNNRQTDGYVNQQEHNKKTCDHSMSYGHEYCIFRITAKTPGAFKTG